MDGELQIGQSEQLARGRGRERRRIFDIRKGEITHVAEKEFRFQVEVCANPEHDENDSKDPKSSFASHAQLAKLCEDLEHRRPVLSTFVSGGVKSFDRNITTA